MRKHQTAVMVSKDAHVVIEVGDTYNPGILEGNHVINVEVAGLGPCGAVVRALPGSRGGLAGIVDLDVFAVALQDVFTAERCQYSNNMSCGAV